MNNWIYIVFIVAIIAVLFEDSEYKHEKEMQQIQMPKDSCFVIEGVKYKLVKQ